MDIVLIGAGGHAAVVAEAVHAEGNHRLLGTLSSPAGQVFDLPHLGGSEDVALFAGCGVIVAVGNNAVRAALYQAACKAGLQPLTIIHPAAQLSPSAVIGPGTVLMAGVIIQARTRIGANCILNTGATIDHDCVIADHVHIAPGVHMAGGVTVGEETFIGVGSAVSDHLAIGRRATVGAGTAVYRDVPPDAKVVGGRMRYIPSIDSDP